MSHIHSAQVFKRAQGFFISLLLLLGSSQIEAQESSLRAVELTFLKSAPGQRENLKQFIVLNWFAMDKVAKAQGLMESFTVMDSGTDEGSWNVLVSVTYSNVRGYEGIANDFEKIRSAHQTVKVKGKALRDLGRVVESKRLLENPAHHTR